MQTDASWDSLDKPRFFTSSAVLFLAVRATIYPIALVKTRLQVASEQHAFRTFKTFKTILRQEGFRALYQGFTVTAIGAIPAQVLYLSSFEASKHYLERLFSSPSLSTSTWHPNQIAVLCNFLGGGIASLSSQCVVIPIDVVSQKLMIQNKKSVRRDGATPYRNGSDVIVNILKNEGISGLYRGSLPSILTYVPSSAVWWGTFALTRRIILYSLGAQTPTPPTLTLVTTSSTTQPTSVAAAAATRDLMVSGMSGFMAGAVSAAVTNPMDVIKTRMQTMRREGGKGAVMELVENVGMLWRSEGWKGFTRGMGARILQIAPVSVMTISTYEIVKFVSVKTD
ncbi:solute carrier family 25 member 44-like protein [Chytridium lagenaria]|nr:solute carrier family 25 member 44-like protein [Chytridium lagenaria]